MSETNENSWIVGFGILAGVALVVFVSLFGLIYKVASADGRADFCYPNGYVQGSYPNDPKVYWRLDSHRPWRVDVTIGFATSKEELRELAKEFGCKYHTEAP